jgi:hypothetical protein
LRQALKRFPTDSRVGRTADWVTGATVSLIGFPPLGLITDDTPNHQLISRRLTERTQFNKVINAILKKEMDLLQKIG